MAMSDCAKCWDTPCQCGWGYRNWSANSREELAARVLGVPLVDLRDRIRAPMEHPMKTNPQWPAATEPPATKRQGLAHAENCPAIARVGYQADCTCNGGSYVASGRGPRQLGAYDG
jgi:hypothetical protein